MIQNMKNYYSYILQILFTLAIAITIWKIFYSFLFQNLKKFSVNIANLFLPNVQKAHNLVTTLSSGAIVLSFTVLQVFKATISVDYSFLIIAWVEFTSSVIIGILIFIVIFVYSTIQSIKLNSVKELSENEHIEDDEKLKKIEIAKLLLQKEFILSRLLIIFSFMQYFLFVLAVSNFLFFSITNL